jgi:hypothetical protein
VKIALISGFPPSIWNIAEYAEEIAFALSAHNAVSKIQVYSHYQNNPANGIVVSDKITVDYCWRLDSILDLIDLKKKLVNSDHDVFLFMIHHMTWGAGRLHNFMGHLLPYYLKIKGKKL